MNENKNDIYMTQLIQLYCIVYIIRH